MILVTGGTGFVGQALIRQLTSLGKPVRTLLRPSPFSPNLPRGVPVEVAVSGFNDERSLRAAMKGVDIIYHLAGTERRGSNADLAGVDIEGTQIITRVAAEAGVKRLFYLSHLGSDRASAFAVLKAKAIAEGFIIQSGIDYTIFRSAVVFGPGDQFTTPLAKLLRLSPGIFLMPGDGMTNLQPLWIDDLVTCMVLSLEDSTTCNQLFSIGGGEYLNFLQIVKNILSVIGIHRRVVSISPAYLRFFSLFVEQVAPRFPYSIFWLDYLAADRTTALDTLPRFFGLMPARFTQQLDFLKSEQQTGQRRRK